MSLVQKESIHRVKLLYAGVVDIGDEGIEQQIEVDEASATSMDEVSGCDGKVVYDTWFYSL